MTICKVYKVYTLFLLYNVRVIKKNYNKYFTFVQYVKNNNYLAVLYLLIALPTKNSTQYIYMLSLKSKFLYQCGIFSLLSVLMPLQISSETHALFHLHFHI